jgi:hypothetical protein
VNLRNHILRDILNDQAMVLLPKYDPLYKDKKDILDWEKLTGISGYNKQLKTIKEEIIKDFACRDYEITLYQYIIEPCL